MVVIDTTARTARSLSTHAVSSSNSRVGASLQYVPELSERGAFVLIGGSLKYFDGSRNSHELGSEMVTIYPVSFSVRLTLLGTYGRDIRSRYCLLKRR